MKKLYMALAIVGALTLAGCSTSDIQELATGGSASNSSGIHYAKTDSNKIKLYYIGQSNPKHYKSIGRVSANNNSIIGTQFSQLSIENKLKTEASNLGANAVININQGLESTTGDAVFIK